MDQLSVRAVNLHDLETGGKSTPSCRRKGRNDSSDFRRVQPGRRCITIPEWDRTGRDRLPTVRFSRSDCAASVPGNVRTRFPSSMRQLDARYGALTLEERRDPAQVLDMLVFP